VSAFIVVSQSLLGVHLAQALESRNGEIFFGVFDDVVKNVRCLFLGHLVAVARHGKRRWVELFNLLGEPA